MACLDMYSSSSTNQNPPMSPRISFSNDFAESNHTLHQQMIKPRSSSEAPASSDFEFSVSNYSMMSADELFFKGRLLPYKDKLKPTTLREELLVEDEDEDFDGFSLRPPKGSSNRWKEILGLKKTHIGSKKPIKSDGSVERRPSLMGYDQEAQVSKGSKELLNEGGSSCRDVEFGM